MTLLIIIFGLGILIAVIASTNSGNNLFRKIMNPWFLGPPTIGLIILIVGINEGGSTLTLACVIFPLSILLGFLFAGSEGNGNGGSSSSGSNSCNGAFLSDGGGGGGGWNN